MISKIPKVIYFKTIRHLYLRKLTITEQEHVGGKLTSERPLIKLKNVFRIAASFLCFALLQCLCFCESSSGEKVCCEATQPIADAPVPCDCTDLALDETRVGPVFELSYFAKTDDETLSDRYLWEDRVACVTDLLRPSHIALPLLYSRLLL